MEERDYVLSSFHSETVTDEEDEDRDDQEGDLDPLLSSQDPENIHRKPRRSRTRVVFNTSTGRSESSSSCSTVESGERGSDYLLLQYHQ